jgi:hypothetical protein
LVGTAGTDGDDERLAQSLLAYVRGLAASGGKMAAISNAHGPIDGRELTQAYEQAQVELSELVGAYDLVHREIDGLVGEFL